MLSTPIQTTKRTQCLNPIRALPLNFMLRMTEILTLGYKNKVKKLDSKSGLDSTTNPAYSPNIYHTPETLKQWSNPYRHIKLTESC